MNEQQVINYQRIEEAIHFIHQNISLQPNLAQVAAHVHVSPYHFQKIFTAWAGVSPKVFLQYLTLNFAKSMLAKKQLNLFNTSIEAGLTSTNILHNLFVKIQGMAPADFLNQGLYLTISYAICNTAFGQVIIAATPKGICYVAFFSNIDAAILAMKNQFKKATYIAQINVHIKAAFNYFLNTLTTPAALFLHIKGTPFQLQVWQALLHVPLGNLTTYGNIGTSITNPNAARAVGTAVGSNPIAYIIPCHRVIQQTGVFGNYMWGQNKKLAILGWEAAKTHQSL